MEVFYLKINRPNVETRRYLKSWLDVIQQLPDSKSYIICDNPDLTAFINKTIDFSNLDCEIIESNRNSQELKYIIEDTLVKNWKKAGYAHLTAFLHARDMGYRDFWNIDADDLKLYASPQKIAELLMAVKEYANTHKIDLFSLDMWTTWTLGQHWSFGVVYTDNSIDWIQLMTAHCKDDYLFERYGRVGSGINADWFCTYLRKIKSARIETFYVENLRVIHDTGNPYINVLGSMRYWSNGKLVFKLLNENNGTSKTNFLAIANEIIKLDIDLTADEEITALRNDYNVYNRDCFQRFDYEHGLDIPVSVIFSIPKQSEYSTPPLQFLLKAC